jgi:hypothetical protein
MIPYLRVPSELLPQISGSARIYERPPDVRSGPRSYTHDGRCLECRSEPNLVIAGDIEALGSPAAAYVARQLGDDVVGFLRFWTRLEVYAKLLATPSLVMFQRCRTIGSLDAFAASRPDIEVRTAAVGDLVVSIGWSPSDRRGRARPSPGSSLGRRPRSPSPEPVSR